MEKTIELISGRLTDMENCVIKNFKVVNDNFEEHRNAINKLFDVVGKSVKKQRGFNKLVLIAGIYGAYTLHKQNKELQELKAKNEVQEQEEK